MIALKVSKTFWMGIWCRSATAAKGKFSWQVSAMSTILKTSEISELGLQAVWRKEMMWKGCFGWGWEREREGVHTYRFGECLRLFRYSCD